MTKRKVQELNKFLLEHCFLLASDDRMSKLGLTHEIINDL